jgi:hypothetical protein
MQGRTNENRVSTLPLTHVRVGCNAFTRHLCEHSRTCTQYTMYQISILPVILAGGFERHQKNPKCGATSACNVLGLQGAVKPQKGTLVTVSTCAPLSLREFLWRRALTLCRDIEAHWHKQESHHEFWALMVSRSTALIMYVLPCNTSP